MDIFNTFEKQMAKISIPSETNHHHIFALTPSFLYFKCWDVHLQVSCVCTESIFCAGELTHVTEEKRP